MRESCFKKEILVSAAPGVIYRCACGTYHVEVGSATLHFDPVQFVGVAHLFKVALGMLAGRSGPIARLERPEIKQKSVNGGMQ